MSNLRMPQSALGLNFQSGASILDYEIQGERANALGMAGRKVEMALEALRAFDPQTGAPEERVVLLKDAAKAVWHYFIQREACGIRNQRPAIEHYRIPGEVLARLGAS